MSEKEMAILVLKKKQENARKRVKIISGKTKRNTEVMPCIESKNLSGFPKLDELKKILESSMTPEERTAIERENAILQLKCEEASRLTKKEALEEIEQITAIRKKDYISKGGKLFEDFEELNEDLKKAKKVFKNFHDSKYKILLAIGPVGCGKTHLSKSVCFEYGYKFVKSTDIYPAVKIYKYDFAMTNRNDFYSMEEMFYSNIVIDDLGSETIDAKELLLEGLKDILDKNRNKIIITTNLTIKELLKRYDDRIMSRMDNDNTYVLLIKGDDYRRKNLSNNLENKTNKEF